MKTPSERKPQTETSGKKPNPTASEASTGKTKRAGSEENKPSKSPAVATWPFAPGSQGDKTPLEAKPVQRAGWNARQFRI